MAPKTLEIMALRESMRSSTRLSFSVKKQTSESESYLTVTTEAFHGFSERLKDSNKRQY